MLIINIIEAEVTIDAAGKPHTYIIKDERMKAVTTYVKELVANQPEIYDYCSYVCYQDFEGDY